MRDHVIAGRRFAPGWPGWCPCSCPCRWGRCENCREQHTDVPQPQPETLLAAVPVWIVGHACRTVCRCWPCTSRRMPSPMPLVEADQVIEQVHRPRLGRRTLQPNYMGQNSCLHLASPVCDGCSRSYHRGCSGWSWPRLHETWIRDSDGSDIYWREDTPHLVWNPPRRCACSCSAARPAAPAATLPPARSSRPTPAPTQNPAPEQPALFDLEAM
ncbi:hypothetical protein AB0I72_19350 [Nocardiopsis sp. NPDC049922]|uniref:hypothetical protein n=1 Tax=Nocardiopsis sp. NPDC049922 TaxID=3155157 RepID=UPI0033FFAF3A